MRITLCQGATRSPNRVAGCAAVGLSASLHGVPLVVVAHGVRWRLESKLPGVSRALQVLQAAAPERPVVFADGTDTVFVRSARSDVDGALLQQVSRSSGRVVFSAECGSWPRCYCANYTGHALHHACLAKGHRTCFPNSGAYIGSSSALLRLLPELVRAQAPGFGNKAEEGDDQAAVHFALLGTVARGMDLAMDEESDLFLNMNACKGSGRLKKYHGLTERCHFGPYEPMKTLTRSYGAPGQLTIGQRVSGKTHSPLLVHANGNHDRLDRTFFGRPGAGGELRLSREAARNLTALWRGALLPQPNAQLLHPVLLIDSARGGPCRIATLDELLRS